MDIALPVADKDFDPALAAAAQSGDLSKITAEQYLAWVHREAEDIPSVIRVDLESQKFVEQSKYMPEIKDIKQCPESLQPSDEWVKDVMYSFSELRGVLARLLATQQNKLRVVSVPAMKDVAAWRMFCLGEGEVEENEGYNGIAQNVEDELDQHIVMEKDAGNEGASISDDDYASDASADGTIDGRAGTDEGTAALRESKLRLLAALNSMDTLPTEKQNEESKVKERTEILEFPIWTGTKCHLPTTAMLLQFYQVLTQHLLKLHCEWLHGTGISELRGQWLYGLLARLEKPLYNDTAAVVRSLYRRCSELRSNIDIDAVTFDTDIAALNVLISITGTYFRQADDIGSSLDPLLAALLLDDDVSLDSEGSTSESVNEDNEDDYDD